MDVASKIIGEHPMSSATHAQNATYCCDHPAGLRERRTIGARGVESSTGGSTRPRLVSLSATITLSSARL
eukprot:scaffold229998_cov31-Tisochrysis_lutea.AAC.2